MISGKYINKITIILVSVILVLCILAMGFSNSLLSGVSSTGYAMEYETALFDTNEVLEIDILMDDAKWNEMLENAKQEIYYECDVVINATTFKQVGIRAKGNTSLSSIASDPDNNRYSFKIEFDQFVDGQTCFGLDKLILNNSYADTTNMKEAIIYDMFQYLDADASLYNYAKISVNNEYWGAYLALEAVEDSFMRRNYGTEQGFLYKPDSMNHNDNNDDNNKDGDSKGAMMMPPEGFQMPDGTDMPMPDSNAEQSGQTPPNFESNTEKEDNTDKANGEADVAPAPSGANGEKQKSRGGGNLNYTDDNLESYSTIWDGQVNDSSKTDHKRVVEALKNVHGQTNIEKYIDVEQVLKYMAVHNFSVNDDSLSGAMAHNYYLYEANGQISIIPWDYNLAFGGMQGGDGTSVVNEPIDASWQSTQLFDFVLEKEEYKACYHEYYERLVNEYLYGGEFDETYNRIRAQIDSLVESDPNSMYTYDEYIKGTQTLYDLIMLRAESLKGQLEGTIASTSEGQKENSAALVDGSHIDISDLGSFMGGGGPGGGHGGNRGGFPGRNEEQEAENNQAYASVQPFVNTSQ